MDRPEKLRALYTKIAEAQKQVVMLMNEEINLTPAKHTKLRGFMIDNRPFPNPTEEWANGLRAICEILSIIYDDQFDKVLDPRNLNLKRFFFSKEPAVQFSKIRPSYDTYEIRHTGIFVDTLSDNDTKKKVIERLGELFECQIYLDYYRP